MTGARRWREAGLATLLLVVAGAAPAAGVYRWVDATGQVHYSDKPIAQAQRVNAATLQSKEVKPAPRLHVSPRFRERVERECATVRERIAMYRSAGNVYGNTVTGVGYELDLAQRARKLEELRAARDRYCTAGAAERLWRQAPPERGRKQIPADAERIGIRGGPISVSR